MKKFVCILLVVIVFPSAVSAQTEPGDSHNLDRLPRTAVMLGFGSATADADFGGGYSLSTQYDGGFVGYGVEASHRIDLTRRYSLRFAGQFAKMESFIVESDPRGQTLLNFDGAFIWKLGSTMTVGAGAGIESNDIRLEASPIGTRAGAFYSGSDYVRLRPAIGGGVHSSIFSARLELAFPYVLSADAIADDFMTDDGGEPDWNLVGRELAYEIVADLGFRLGPIFELGLKVAISSWGVTYDQRVGNSVTIVNQTTYALLRAGLTF